jgi:hypothetical protein
MKLLLAKTIAQSCFTAIFLGAIAIPVGAVNLYVATNGSNNNSGTINKPLASIQEAINRAKAGDIIYLRGGVYKPTQQIWMGQSGKANARIVLQSYPGEKATIDGSAIAGINDDITNILAIGGQYIDVKGLEVRNSPSVGILTWRAKNIRILNNNVHHTQGTGIGMYESSDMTANGNAVYRSNLANQKRNMKVIWGQGISSGRSTRVSVNQNRVYENYGEGIGCFLTSSCSATNNIVYDNYSVEMYLDNATNSLFARNLIYNTGNSGFFRNYDGIWTPASGIQMANEAYETSNPLNYNSVRNNIVINSSDGFAYGNYQNGGGLKNTQILNNTFYGETNQLLSLARDAGHKNSLFANNIFYQTNNKPMTLIDGSVSGIRFTDNLWFGGTPDKAVTSPQDIFANPLFVNGGGFKASDYKLKAASPAIDKGKTLSEVPFDYFGTKRPVNGAYDIGAQEYKSGSANLLLASLGLDTDSQTIPEPNNLLGLLFLGGLGLGRFLKRN